MSSFHGDTDDDDDDKIVVEALEPPVRDQLAKGTRRQVALVRPPEPAAAPEPPPLRDPIDVLKMWPVSSEAGETAQHRATLRAPSPGPHLDDKIRLAHLALDLYRELEAGPTGPGAALHRGPTGDCDDPRCQARTNALRGALVEACLLVQRIALMTADERSAVDDRLRELLSWIGH